MCEVRLMDETHNIMTALGQSARGLIELLYQDKPLDRTEQLFIETHLVLIRSAFDGWKLRNVS
jgi:hypothetical protein